MVIESRAPHIAWNDELSVLFKGMGVDQWRPAAIRTFVEQVHIGFGQAEVSHIKANHDVADLA